jgi:hypothetical protein
MVLPSARVVPYILLCFMAMNKKLRSGNIKKTVKPTPIPGLIYRVAWELMTRLRKSEF